MDKFKKILSQLFFPPLIVSAPAIFISAFLLAYVFGQSKENTILAYFSYILSAYSLVIVSCKIPFFIRKGKKILHSNKYTQKYISDLEFRARISLQLGLFINLIYSIFKMILGVYYASFWFGAEAVYYFVLSVMRYTLIRKEYSKQKTATTEWKTYKNCGFLMLLLNMIMSVIIFQTINKSNNKSYSEYVIYANAAYTFYRLTLSIIHIVKYNPRKYSTLSASKLINLSAVLMSLFALQSSMLAKFSTNIELNGRAFNSATGCAVCIITVSTALFMIFNAKKKIKSLNISQT